MMIRYAVHQDKTSVILLLKAARDAAGFDRPDGATGFSFPFDPVYAERLFLAHLEPGRLCQVLVERGIAHGVLMAVAIEHPFGPVKLARETVWFIEPKFRGRAAAEMLAAYEAWAASQGCLYSALAGMGEDPAVGKLYRRRGYRVAETHFLKAV
jgi:GNAT superfamily N-acetyltransferase